MSNEREMLEMAAKAAGMVYRWEQPPGATWGNLRAALPGSGPAFPIWNPLVNDGDALRLSVKLDMNVFHASGSAYAIPNEDDGTYEEKVPHGADPYAATRRAIVRAAAEIGRAME